jgi:dihydropteroate synthase
MAILNVTPDSFSDGGTHFGYQEAVDAGRRMVEEGADLVDVGGESTRPGSEPVPVEEELGRVLPVVQALSREGIAVSIDTSKAAVAREATAAGAVVVNDVTALADPEMAGVCAEAGCTVCLMHMKGTPKTMQREPHYENVVREVRDHLLARAAYAEAEGIGRDRIWIDPGIGFGKTIEHNLQLLRRLEDLVATRYPLLVGASRKGFIGRILGGEGAPFPADQRLEGTLAVQVLAQAKGARIIRAHDVRASRRALAVAAAALADA